MSEKEQHRPWWGDYEVELDEAVKWEIGPLSFWLRRSQSEWRLAHEWAEEEPAGWDSHGSAQWPEGDVETERFAVSETTGGVRLRPMPADRAVVARPKTPLRVLSGHRARVFMSSPLWVEIGVGTAPTVLRELATKRLSDTWFGATTRDGELSYALKTNARMGLVEMPRARYRLLTPVVIENRAEDALTVERLSLPVPFLSIYGAETGEAWSEEVRMLRTEDGDLAELDVRDGPPVEAVGATKLSEARQIAEKGHLIRAFGSLLGFD